MTQSQTCLWLHLPHIQTFFTALLIGTHLFSHQFFMVRLYLERTQVWLLCHLDIGEILEVALYFSIHRLQLNP